MDSCPLPLHDLGSLTLPLSHDIKIGTIESIGRYDSHHLKIHHFISYPELNISSAGVESSYQLELVGVESKFEEL